MFSVTDSTYDSTIHNGSKITFDDLSADYRSGDIDSMYIGASNWVSSSNEVDNCWSSISGVGNIETMAGYIEWTPDDEEYYWEWGAAGWFMIVSLVMSMFFIFIEWLFYSYHEIMIPGKDHRAFIWWYLVRIAWMSYMFTVLIAHSLLVDDEVGFLIGRFKYQWLEADGFIATAFVALCMLICLCCCCFNESM